MPICPHPGVLVIEGWAITPNIEVWSLRNIWKLDLTSQRKCAECFVLLVTASSCFNEPCSYCCYIIEGSLTVNVKYGFCYVKLDFKEKVIYITDFTSDISFYRHGFKNALQNDEAHLWAWEATPQKRLVSLHAASCGFRPFLVPQRDSFNLTKVRCMQLNYQ